MTDMTDTSSTTVVTDDDATLPPAERERRARDAAAAAVRVSEVIRLARAAYAAQSAAPLYDAITDIKRAMAAVVVQFGSIASDADFAALQGQIVAALTSSIAEVSALTPPAPKGI